MSKKFVPPNIGNYTPSALVDECAPLQAEYNRLDKLTKFLKTGLKARLTQSDKIDTLTYLVKGEKFHATISEETRMMLNGFKVRELLTEEQYLSCLSEVKSQTVRFFEAGNDGSEASDNEDTVSKQGE